MCCNNANFPSAREDVAAALLDRHADINIRDLHGATPLHKAASVGALRLVHFLLGRGADINAFNGNGQSPVDVAACHRQAFC